MTKEERNERIIREMELDGEVPHHIARRAVARKWSWRKLEQLMKRRRQRNGH